jgi:DNA (cytosine-5)-methyltransferase 1
MTTHASLFSGIGGAEVAAAWMGWRNVFHCEIQEFPRKVLDFWFPNAESYEDITKTDFTKWGGKIDVLTGGFPCQPFSIAGRRKGEKDNRYLWQEMHRAIKEIHPTWVIGENVAGITTMVESSETTYMGHTPDLFEARDLYRTESRFTLDRICQDIEDAGYEVQPLLIPACSVGAPHRRDRIWIVAHRTDAGIEAMQQGGQDGVLPDGTAADTIGKGLQGQHHHHDEKAQGAVHPMGRDAARLHNPIERGANRGFEGFPTTEPTIRRGDDGLPFRMDDLSVSFGKWRQESIKAYGNAWVPQVAYEIFRAIETIQNQQENENRSK